MSPNTASSTSHWSTANDTPYTVVATTRTTKAREELMIRPPTAIPSSTDMKSIGAAK